MFYRSIAAVCFATLELIAGPPAAEIQDNITVWNAAVVAYICVAYDRTSIVRHWALSNLQRNAIYYAKTHIPFARLFTLRTFNLSFPLQTKLNAYRPFLQPQMRLQLASQYT